MPPGCTAGSGSPQARVLSSTWSAVRNAALGTSLPTPAGTGDWTGGGVGPGTRIASQARAQRPEARLHGRRVVGRGSSPPDQHWRMAAPGRIGKDYQLLPPEPRLSHQDGAVAPDPRPRNPAHVGPDPVAEGSGSRPDGGYLWRGQSGYHQLRSGSSCGPHGVRRHGHGARHRCSPALTRASPGSTEASMPAYVVVDITVRD